MSLGLLDAFESSLNLIALLGLILDAGGAILVLGPDVPTVSKIATVVERREMNFLFQKLKKKGRLHKNVEPFNRLFQQNWAGNPVPFEVEELVIEDNKVIMGKRDLKDGERTSISLEEFQQWIDNYRGMDREYYLAGGGLLLVGFLFQIVAQSADLFIWLSVLTFLITLIVSAYFVYRARNHIWRPTT
jgi:hypothetical protein